MKKNIFLPIICAFLSVSLLASCGNSGTASVSSSSPAASQAQAASDSGDKVLSVLVEGGSPAYKVAVATADEFKQKTGYTVKIDSVPYAGVHDKLDAEIKAGTAIHDVATIDVLWIPELSKGLEPLDTFATPEMRSDFIPQLEEGATYDSHFYGIPAWTNCKVLIYRKDLFNDEKNKADFKAKYGYDLVPPTTWQQYEDTAKFFTKDDMYGTTVFGANSGDSVCSWMDFATQAGAKPLVIDSTNKPLLTEKPYVDSLTFMKKLYDDKSVPPETLTISSAETDTLFTSGKIAMELIWGHFYVDTNKKMPGKVGVAPMIGGSAGIGAIPGPWYQVVLKNSKNKDIAEQYLQFLYDKNYMYMDTLGVAARKSVFADYSKKDGYEHLDAILKTLEAPASQNRPATAKWTQIESEVLTPIVQNVISGKDINTELKNGSNQINEILGN